MLDDDEAEVRDLLLARYELTGNPAFRRAADQLCKGPSGAKIGRPSEEDTFYLRRMASLVVGRGLSERAAAKNVAADAPGNSPEAVADRLRRKFRQYRPTLMAMAFAARDAHEFSAAIHSTVSAMRADAKAWGAIRSAIRNEAKKQRAIETAVENWVKKHPSG